MIFGKENFNSNFNLADINGNNGIVLNGIDAYDSANTSLFISNSVSAAGDVNSDGFDDIIIGASYTAPNNQVDAGKSYVVFGRDFNNSVTQAGTKANDLLIGTVSKDILVGRLGNDTFLGNVDVLNGGTGNDIINFSASARRMNGGSGTDTLSFESSNINLDLTAIANTKIIAFETIDITGTGNNSLNFTSLDVVDLSHTTNQLVSKGNSGDAVTSIAQGWKLLDTNRVDNMLYNRYIGAATLLVGTGITQTIIS